ncbi:MAG: guanosine-3',5'-bis(diphosphate) 3'-pyrophosphohydrolase [Cellvibrionaceae bacterium]|jgi:guanosine-3',5'-bis(diphosphate) 3'-pyrophosphohydrolase
MSDFEIFSEELSDYLDHNQINEVRQAYEKARAAHAGQSRRSGDPYITHPLAVAKILCSMRMDHHSLMAAMLHDVIEDTGVSKGELVEEFGETVAELVDGVSKLTHIEFASQEEKQAKNFEKMAIAMAKDIRVIIVKLADRLHNMRTLESLKIEKRRRIAKETLEIYARIAGRLGMQDLRIEFEERGFEALYPLRARLLRAAVDVVRKKQRVLIDHIQQSLKNQIHNWGIEAEVIGREKHSYGIYRKLKDKKKFRDITDVFAFRIITQDVESCYRVLGAVHMLYKPFSDRFKDYIAIPKVNGYQSIHTVLNGVENIPIEVQIRTHEMDAIASSGIAAHWLYKSDDDNTITSHSRARRWVSSLLELQQIVGNSLEFIEHVKNDLFSDGVYVFTPKGEIVELPAGATAVDMAYAIHTEIGNHCTACRINNRLASLAQPLENGQQVYIINKDKARPRAIWLNTVKTSKARSAIHNALKTHQKQDAIDLGRRMLTRTLAQLKVALSDVFPQQFEAIFEELNCKNLDQLLYEIGLGERMASTVAKLLFPEKSDQVATHVQSPLAIDSVDGTMISLARCCHPIPGDHIIGIINPGKGLAIHLDTCKNISDIRQRPDKLSEVSWSSEVSGEFPVDLLIIVESYRGIFAELASRITAMGANIEKIQYKEQDSNHNNIRITLGVKSRVHLADIMRRIRGLKAVERIIRDKN